MLDLLHRVKWEHDGRLTFRRSCAHGVCGSDAMLINGRNRLACKIRVDQLGKKISVAPLPGLNVIKDLVVDMDGFFTPNDSAIFGTFYDEAVTSLPEPSALGALGISVLTLSPRRWRRSD